MKGVPFGLDVTGLDHQISQPMIGPRRELRFAWMFVPTFLLIHGIVAVGLPQRLDPLSTVFIVLAQLAAITACIRAARSDTVARGFWLLLVSAIILHSAAMSIDALSEIFRVPLLDHVPAVPVFLSLLDGVPVLVAVSFQNDARVRLPARIVHTSLSIAIGALIYVQTFRVLSIFGGTGPSDELLVTRLFDLMDVFLSVTATIRCMGSTREPERRFFGILCIFLWTNTVCCAAHNRALMRHDDWIWLDLLVAAPYALLVPLALTARARTAAPRSGAFVRAVQSGSPLFLAVALACLGIVETRSHFYVGISAALFAIAGYGVLNILVQSRGLQAEELLQADNKALERLVDLDPLTGIANRRAFDETLLREFAGAMRSRQPLSLLMIDVDRFKDLNDARGHIIGDEYLVHIATILRSALPRSTDFIGRYGGEEFSAILPATDSHGALIAAERVRSSTADFGLSHPTARSGIVTVSIGVSTYDGSMVLTPEALIEAADCALYRAKDSGRNCCVYLPMNDRALASSRSGN